MSQRLASKRQPFHLDRNTLWLIGLLIGSFSIFGRGILQNRVLGMLTNPDGLNALLESSPDAMNAATASILLEAIAGTAVPIFAVLTVDGLQQTGNVKKYLIRVALLAIVSEFLYNLALTGTFWSRTSRNPAFGVLLALFMLYLLQSFDYLGKVAKAALHVFVLACSLLWALLFQVEYGTPMILICYMLWIFRNRHTMAYLAGSAAALICTTGNPLFMFAPFGFLIAHYYNGDQGSKNPLRYVLYPAILLLIWLAGVLLF